MIPSNNSEFTPEVITTLPYNFTQRVDDAGTTYTVWYKYVGVAGLLELGFNARENNLSAVYNPTIEVFTGTPGSLIPYLFITVVERAIQIPTSPTINYFFRITPNGGNPSPADLIVNAYAGPRNAISVGDLLINDDTDGFPGVIISSITGLPINFIHPLPAGEHGDVLNTGGICLSDGLNGVLHFYDNQFNELNSFAFNSNPRIRTCLGLQRFYVAYFSSPNMIVNSYNGSGILQTTNTLAIPGAMSGFAMSNDGSIAYYSQGTGTAIKRWNLITGALPDLAAGTANFKVTDILVMLDSIVIMHYNISSGLTQVKRYSSAGALLNTYSIGSTSRNFVRLAYSLDNSISFWTWIHLAPQSLGTSRFQEIRMSDGVVLQTLDVIEFEGGIYVPVTPGLADFGISFSCPFLVMRSNITMNNGDGSIFVKAAPPTPVVEAVGSGIYKIVKSKRNDTIWVDLDLMTTRDVKIPNPFGKTGMLGE